MAGMMPEPRPAGPRIKSPPDDLAVSAVSIIGPRNKVSKLVQNLSLLH